MRVREASQRYAKALFNLATDEKRVELVLNEIREFNTAVEKDHEIKLFFTSPVFSADDQRTVLDRFLDKKKLSDEASGLFKLLIAKRRFAFLPEIVTAFQSAVDHSQGVARGEVRSATTLFPEERSQLESTISKYTGKKAVLEYHNDGKLLGGLVAQVGSFTFDDSLETQLRLMRDDLKKRRSH